MVLVVFDGWPSGHLVHFVLDEWSSVSFFFNFFLCVLLLLFVLSWVTSRDLRAERALAKETSQATLRVELPCVRSSKTPHFLKCDVS